MTEANFRNQRRQKFLTEKYFQLNYAFCKDEIAQNTATINSKQFLPSEIPYSGIPGSSFKNQLKLIRLTFTSGASIDSLHQLYTDAVNFFEIWHQTYREYIAELARTGEEELRDDGSPCYFEDLFHFQLVLEIISLGVLLGESDKVRQIVTWLSRYRHTDMMFESIVEQYVTDPSKTETFFHEAPYGLLLDAIYTAQTSEEARAYVQSYLDSWYKSFEGVPWHNGHLVQTEEYSNYEGYWAFEAAAVCVLYGIDDTSFRDHLVYPKDLADWARANHVLDRVNAVNPSDIRLRCEAGQPCPQAGYWFTPAKVDSRRTFKQGDIMPAVDSAYGATIWQWGADQQN
ncbi:PoNe immunity protein domain-containing protein [Chitinimonas taiwanensis]|uniref:PoNi C-terminal domain-containing protein n=1 Tax=Chitinimonas taiwanensis DSM 18899 TaxID=1121279 RepID=A0A1K2HKT7_9NEIS|nr:PoNe immunity protein domain-containing protein [Chitinimonas taiwanensis]SFZ77390.1 protein of unknown function [Chitinimonas taiwanensis DSM 18899]